MRRRARLWLPIALVLAPMLEAQNGCVALGPCYAADGLVNSASGQSGFLAPYTFATLYGTNLSYNQRSRTGSDPPPGLGGVQVMVGPESAMVFYVSATQVNFLVPASWAPGPVTVQLFREAWFGPVLTVTLLEVAPALFCLPPPDQTVAVAQLLPDYATDTADAPAQPGEYVILYATGLGYYGGPSIGDYNPPQTAIQIALRPQFQVLLDGVVVDDQLVEYVGSVVGYWGLIQINLKLPANVGSNPEIRLAIGSQTSPAGVHLLVK
jgi:uncharacterized protein (TIGR03437 family)